MTIIEGFYWVNPVEKSEGYKVINTHEEAYEDAKKNGYETILILEGELIFQKEWKTKMENYIKELDEKDPKWELLMLNSMGIISWKEEGIRRAKDMYLKGGYIMRNGIGKEIGEIQKEDKGYFIFPFMILQKNNYTWKWIEENFLPNYGKMFEYKEEKIMYITYADERYKMEAEKNLLEINYEKKKYTPQDIDTEFYENNKHILSCSKGSGYWLWKPYFILKTLLENDIDYVVYCDSGSKIYNWNGLFQNDVTCFHLNNNQGINFHAERRWTKMDLIKYLDCYNEDILNSDQKSACAMVIKKTPKNIVLVKQWLHIGCIPHMIDDSKNIENDDPYFIDHRHDQSIWSLLCKKNGYNSLLLDSYVHHHHYDINLEDLGKKYGTDKVSHGFCKNYHSIFRGIRRNFTKIAEIGVFFGSSILMWKDYFPLAHIYGLDAFLGLQGNGSSFQGFLDFYRKWKLNPDPRIELVQLDQSQRSQLESFTESNFDMILDDASHLMKDQQQTLGVMFPLVKQGGYFIIEDVHTSVQEGYDVEGDNTTLIMLERYEKTKKWKSKYMTENEMDYLNNHTKSIKLFNNNGSMTCVIHKL